MNLLNTINLPVDIIKELSSLCVQLVYFKYKEIFHKQREGPPMQSSLSPTFASIFMAWFENLVFVIINYKPKIGLRFLILLL